MFINPNNTSFSPNLNHFLLSVNTYILGFILLSISMPTHIFAPVHIARHTFATMSLNNHVPLETIQKMLGHSDIATTQIYARLLDKTISEDMVRMREKFDTIPVDIKPLPEPPVTFPPEPQPKRGRPRKYS